MQLANRTLDILEAALELKRDFSLIDLVNKTGLNIYAVRRFVNLFVNRGYLYQERRGGNYSVGFQLLRFNEVKGSSIILKERASPLLEKLGLEIRSTIHMAIFSQNQAVTIAVVPIKGVLFQIMPDEGSRFPLHATSLGKIFLAYLPDQQRRKIVDTLRLTAFTNNTITNKLKLLIELEEIRKVGVSFDDEEYEIGVRGAAAPIRDQYSHVVAGVGSLGATIRVSRQKMRRNARQVKDTALQISRLLGYSGEFTN